MTLSLLCPICSVEVPNETMNIHLKWHKMNGHHSIRCLSLQPVVGFIDGGDGKRIPMVMQGSNPCSCEMNGVTI